MTVPPIDEELKQLAALTLCNAFWADFSALVNKYLEATVGLDIDGQEQMMGELTSIYGRDTKAKDFDINLNIYTQNGTAKYATSGHDTILEALEYDKATKVFLRGDMVFERRDGEWYFTGT